MAELPILFGGPMVKAILEGRKTQTRRVIKPQPPVVEHEQFFPSIGIWLCKAEGHDEKMLKCPYGIPGDRLWVRETFTTFRKDTEAEGAAKLEAAKKIASIEDLERWSNMPSGGGGQSVLYKADFGEWADNPESDLGPWKPSIHMPRWASRILLEIVSIRVERVQDITSEDALAEGIEDVGGQASCNPYRNYLKGEPGEMNMHCSAPTRSFQTLWDSINAKRGFGWDANPWVYRIEFRRAE